MANCLNLVKFIGWQFFKKTRRRRASCLWICILLCVVLFVWRIFSTDELEVFAGYSLQKPKGEQANQACVHPDLPLYALWLPKPNHQDIRLDCGSDGDWVYTSGGKFYISKQASDKYGHIVCSYQAFSRGQDDDSVVFSGVISPMLNGTNLTSDFFKVDCKAGAGNRYSNVHASIAYDQRLHSRKVKTEPSKGPTLDVLMLGLDTVSRNRWRRELPKSHEFFTNKLGGIILEGYNIVGDGTPQALVPILTGKDETMLPEVRKSQTGSQYVDVYPFIWNKFREAGYVTQWAEDRADIGTFNMRMNGFKHQPTDHYMRPFYLEATPTFSRYKDLCQRAKPRHQVFLNWIKEYFEMYQSVRKFTFAMYAEIPHSSEYYQKLHLLDEDIRDFLRFLSEKGHLNKTLLILMSDHGPRFHSIRKSEQGKLEERMPYFGFRFPEWMDEKHREEMKVFRMNSKRLTTPFDIHETFLSILNFSSKPIKMDSNKRGISLFNEIPLERTCKHAHIEPHWCACLQWQDISIDHANVVQSVNAVIRLINNMTREYRNHCRILQLDRIKWAKIFSVQPDILLFKESSDIDGRVPDMSDGMRVKEVLYQVTFITDPGGGMFEATVKYITGNDVYKCNKYEISRLNKYGDASKCIIDKAPQLRPYCLCNT